MVIYLESKATKEEIEKAKEEFGDYIKVVIDIFLKRVAMGGKLHSDAERVLIDAGSAQKDIWGGGLDLKSGRIDAQAVINIRPSQGNDSMEILDPVVRSKFMKIAKAYL